MILVFDLDDTLYDEKQFVYSGFSEVANWISKMSNTPANEILDFMIKDLSVNGRGLVFNNALKKYFRESRKNTKKCISIYRLHKPKISLEQDVINLLLELGKDYNLYILTDGNKIVQSNKIKSLDIEKYIKKAFITHRYGLKASKPSLKCFQIIRNIEKINWHELVYIGDNPNKDFVNLNQVNAITIRVLQGDYSNTKAKNGYDAKYKINALTDLRNLINTNL